MHNLIMQKKKKELAYLEQRRKSATATASYMYSFQNWVRCLLVQVEFVRKWGN